MSQASASSSAPARHQPRTHAMVGFSSDQSCIVTSTSRRSARRQAAAPSMRLSASSVRSKPAENARPAPVSTTTRTSSSAAARASASSSPATIGTLSALSLSGRLSVIQADGPRRSYRTTSLMRSTFRVATAPRARRGAATIARMTSPVDLAALLEPRLSAVLGASDRGAALDLIANLGRGGGRVIGINPRRTEVAGVRCVPSAADLPELPDIAAVAVGRRASSRPSRTRSRPASGASSCRAWASRTATPGARAREELVALLREAGASMAGPNCMGIATPRGPSAWIGTVLDDMREGGVASVVQSGSIGEALLSIGPRLGQRAIISSGTESICDAADWLAFFAADVRTRAIGLFLETVRRPAAFEDALRAAAEAGKPVVVLKVGRSQAGARRALAHSGAIVGSSARSARSATPTAPSRSPTTPTGSSTSRCSARRAGRAGCAPSCSRTRAARPSSWPTWPTPPACRCPSCRPTWPPSWTRRSPSAARRTRSTTGRSRRPRRSCRPPRWPVRATRRSTRCCSTSTSPSASRTASARTPRTPARALVAAAAETGTFCALLSTATTSAADEVVALAAEGGVPVLQGAGAGLRAVAAAARWSRGCGAYPRRSPRRGAGAGRRARPAPRAGVEAAAGALRRGRDARAARRHAGRGGGRRGGARHGGRGRRPTGRRTRKRSAASRSGCARPSRRARLRRASAGRCWWPRSCAAASRSSAAPCATRSSARSSSAAPGDPGPRRSRRRARSAGPARARGGARAGGGRRAAGRPARQAGAGAVADVLVALGRAMDDCARIAEIDVNPLRVAGSEAVALDALVVLDTDSEA